jgi:nitrate reductase delta subunit
MSEYEDALRQWTRPKAADPDLNEDLLSPRQNAELAEALTRVKEWVRTRFALPEDAAIMVSEVACNLPGCPPLETAVAFWEGDTRHHFKMFKRASEVGYDDLPYAWMKESLIVPEGFECECC